ncbi:MAG: hypothetical protein HUU26_13785 [Gemmatimonadaceae bacterium]|nr:hypothetical protein [Gemmatimonadaceae bacterium]
MATLLNEYRDLRAAGFARPAQQDSFDFRRPDAAVRLLSASQRVLLNVLVDSATEGLWLRADSGGPVYRLDAWMGSRLFPAESGFVVQGSGFRVRGSGA